MGGERRLIEDAYIMPKFEDTFSAAEFASYMKYAFALFDELIYRGETDLDSILPMAVAVEVIE